MMSRGADVLCLFFVLRRLVDDISIPLFFALRRLVDEIPTPAQSPFFALRRLVDDIS